MITDCHLHSFSRHPIAQGGDYVPPARDIRDYSNAAAPMGVRRAAVVQASVDGTDNSRLVSVLGTNGAIALRGVAAIDASADLPALHDAGVRAIRVQDRARLGASDLPDLPALASRVAELGWHIELNPEPRSFERIAAMLPNLPRGLTLILDHAGHVDPAAPDALLRLMQTGRVWVKLSPMRIRINIGRYEDLVGLIETIGSGFPEQILRRSDWPHVMTPDPVPDIRPMLELCRAALSAENFQRCMWDNPERLHGF